MSRLGLARPAVSWQCFANIGIADSKVVWAFEPYCLNQAPEENES